MSGTHILKALRHAVNDLITDAAISIDVAGSPTLVKVLSQPPSGRQLDAQELPAIFVFVPGESIKPDTYQSYERGVRVSIYMLAHGTGDPLDQLDDMQLEIERLMEGSGFLGGLCYSLFPVEMSAVQEQGVVVFASRILEYRCVATVTSADPSI